MSTKPLHPSHPVAAAVARIETELTQAAGVPVWSMGAGEAGEVLEALTRARAQTDALLLRVLRHADSVETGLASGATSTTNWWAHRMRMVRRDAHALRRLATQVEAHPEVAEALESGRILTDQARAITDALEQVPEDAEPWVLPAATERMLDLAADHDAKDLRVLGRRLLEVIDPATADAEEARRLEAEERAARERVGFGIRDSGDGTMRGWFTLPVAQGEMLRRQVHAIAWSKHTHPTTTVAEQTNAAAADADAVDGAVDPVQAQRHRPLSRTGLGEAFCELIESRPADTLPTSGGISATVVVTMELDTLLGGLKAASLDTGSKITAGQARRLACEAGIIPIVLGGPSVVLDMGRRRRFHTPAQRIAMGVRDGGCSAAGCDMPADKCQAHHETPWSKGGSTSVKDGRFYCPSHHQMIHDPAFQHHLDKHGKVRFSRRT
ncbi:HNH endonuclease [Nocardioides rotundus]|uniref:HNH endonuclease signature motif containing protein n=1 Tax=Nocardioides rotundus TaxID=1774216 RepID=UPI001CBE4A67|nr:HNH endonuclease signature motif containing protein [Nocardioides rotundus]UAL28622.1 HNH endonuclease [Nocardioides rotundus]